MSLVGSGDFIIMHDNAGQKWQMTIDWKKYIVLYIAIVTIVLLRMMSNLPWDQEHQNEFKSEVSAARCLTQAEHFLSVEESGAWPYP